MTLEIRRAELHDIAWLRSLYYRELGDVVPHEPQVLRGELDLSVLLQDDRPIGHGIVDGASPGGATIVEFYVLPYDRRFALSYFDQFLHATGAAFIAARTDDPILTVLLFDRAEAIASVAILFRDHQTTHYAAPGTHLRPITHHDRAQLARELCQPEAWPYAFADTDALERWIERGVGWLLEQDHAMLAVGSINDDRNLPFVDLGMRVIEPYRQQGYGAYIIQELKRQAYRRGAIPVARCDVTNHLSRRTLQTAGFLPIACLVQGRVRR
jgi:GNAT superfamily N-acetyltransferase